MSMLEVKKFSVEKIPIGNRAAYWSSLIGGFIAEIQTTPYDKKNFQASLKVAEFGSLIMAEATSTPARIEHDSFSRCSKENDCFVLHLQTKGASWNTQGGRQALLQKGDFLLCDSARPFEVSFSSSNRMFAIRIPKKQLSLRLPFVEELFCLPQNGSEGASALVSNLILSLWHQYGACDRSEVKNKVCESVLDLLAASYLQRYYPQKSESSVIYARRRLIIDFVEKNLHDADLSIRKVSRALGYSVGYIHQLFRDEQESISRYIKRRRLEKSANCLKSPIYAANSISEIAFLFGFNSGSHFGRAFKQYYRVTPRQYRQGARDPA